MADTRPAVLITGASAGIGAATAVLAAQNGYDVGIGFRSDVAGAEKTAEQVRAAGGQAVLLRGDMGNAGEIAQMFQTFDASFSKLDAFVNNAGIVAPTSRVEDMTAERIGQVIGVNLTGAILAAGHAVRRMARRYDGAGGVIVNISSIAATAGGSHQYIDYAATKGGIDTLTRGLALENAEEGIRVCGIRPGIIATDIHAKGGQPDRVQKLAHIIPVKRAGTADEVAQTIVWLMSDAASYVTGATLDVSGGR